MSMVRRPETAFSLDPSGKHTKRVEEPKHLAFIRTLPSAVSGLWGCEACHIRMGDPRHNKPSTGGGRKPSDWFVLPLTPEEHCEQHSMSERAYWINNGIYDPVKLALDLYSVTGDHDAAVRLIREAKR